MLHRTTQPDDASLRRGRVRQFEITTSSRDRGGSYVIRTRANAASPTSRRMERAVGVVVRDRARGVVGRVIPQHNTAPLR